MFEGMPFISRGLIVALFGLAGTFLVLILIFGAIKLMQKLSIKDAEKS